ncbi:MAG: hypothetical protein MUF87_21540 [Anaerolineae bacterium]|jgi:hypothetical protein|nr:hypothetical protein [Anaerolineae bacterium]
MDSDTPRHFRLADIVERHLPGVTQIIAAHHMQACLICLDYHRHVSGLQLTVVNEQTNEKYYLNWDEQVDDQMRRSWKDLQEATEQGAVAIAILLVINCTEYTIIERAAKGNGFDYWLLEDALYDENELIPTGTARLEVSGIIHAEKEREIRARVKEKIKQTQVSDDGHLPALIMVIEFSRPEAHMVRKR